MKTEPIVHDYLTQIFVKHYKMTAEPAAEEALRFLEIIDLYKMQLILGDWTKIEEEKIKTPRGRWDLMIDVAKRSIDESGEREPWKSPEIQ